MKFAALVVALVSSCLLSAQEPAPVRPKTGKVQIFKQADLKPGMKGYAWTVLPAAEPEPIPVEIIGILKNQWGPNQDVILAKLGGKATRTNVAGGMSGSPVYIDGKLVGAVALRFSVFSPDAICGITPIELMLEVNDFDNSRPLDARTPDKTVAQEPLSVPSENAGASAFGGRCVERFLQLHHGSDRNSADLRGLPRKRAARILAVLPANGHDRGGGRRVQHHAERQAGSRAGSNRCSRATRSPAFWSPAT